MDTSPSPAPESSPTPSAIERAIAFGVDITLLIENLRLTPTERLRRGEQFLKSVVAFRTEVERARKAQKGIGNESG